MKRQVCALITALAIILAMPTSLVSCGGGAKQLPDVYIDLEVTDFITIHDIYRPYTYESDHSYDSETHMDTVNITLRVEYDYGDEVYSGKCIYLYDRTSDTWKCIDSFLGNWIKGEDQYIERYIEKSYRNTDLPFTGRYNGLYDITIKKVDFKNAKVSCSYYIKAQSTSIFSDETITASGEGTFDIINGNKFWIPFENGKFEVLFSIKTGITSYISVELD